MEKSVAKSLTVLVPDGLVPGAIFNKILYTITGYKNWLVTQIGSLFTEFYSFKKMLVTFNRKSKSQLEIAMFMQSFKTLAHQFGDLAIVCGVEPCYDDDTGNTNNQIKIVTLGKLMNAVTDGTNIDKNWDTTMKLPFY